MNNFPKSFKRGGFFSYQKYMLQIFLHIEDIFENDWIPKRANVNVSSEIPQKNPKDQGGGGSKAV